MISRGQKKLEFAIKTFNIDVQGKVCADLGSHAGGFVACLLNNGAKKVYAVEKGYGVLDWNLRNNPKVIVMEHTNALHVKLPELVDIVTIDVGWTKQSQIIPKALELLKPGGTIVSLIKPHYEAPKNWLNKGKLSSAERYPQVIHNVKNELQTLYPQLIINDIIESPITGLKGGNKEYLMWGFKLI